MMRYGFYPLLPDGMRRGIRRVLGGIRSDSFDPSRLLHPDLRDILEGRRTLGVNRTQVRPASIRQRELASSLSDSFGMHAREFEERMAASIGIELRRPFFDVRMVQFAFAAPASVMLRGQTEKFLHRQAMRHVLPDSIVNRKGKAEFSITFRWYLPDLKAMLQAGMLPEHVNWMGPDSARSLLRLTESRSYESGALWLIWSLLGCEMVAGSVLEAAGHLKGEQCHISLG